MPKEAESETSPPSPAHCNADAAPEQKGGVLQPSALQPSARTPHRGSAEGTALLAGSKARLQPWHLLESPSRLLNCKVSLKN